LLLFNLANIAYRKWFCDKYAHPILQIFRPLPPHPLDLSCPMPVFTWSHWWSQNGSLALSRSYLSWWWICTW